jgi:hypothetical protein
MSSASTLSSHVERTYLLHPLSHSTLYHFAISAQAVFDCVNVPTPDALHQVVLPIPTPSRVLVTPIRQDPARIQSV